MISESEIRELMSDCDAFAKLCARTPGGATAGTFGYGFEAGLMVASGMFAELNPDQANFVDTIRLAGRAAREKHGAKP